jgi:hypothetical protein
MAASAVGSPGIASIARRVPDARHSIRARACAPVRRSFARAARNADAATAVCRSEPHYGGTLAAHRRWLPMEVIMIRPLRTCLVLILLFAASTASASFHLFRIEQIYSNADRSLQFVVMHESTGSNGENFWAGQRLTSSDGAVTNVFTFPSNLPSGITAGRRVLIATAGFAALGLVTPDYVVPNGFLPTVGGTLDFAGVDAVTYGSLPVDGVSAIDRTGAIVPNVATNFAGASASVRPVTAAFTPAVGLWWNPDESGTGYNLDTKHGVLVVTMFTYEATGHSEWYLAAGPLTDNGTKFSATLDKYRGGQCASCPYTGRPTLAGSDGNISITFTSATSAVVSLPNSRTTVIRPQDF